MTAKEHEPIRSLMPGSQVSFQERIDTFFQHASHNPQINDLTKTCFARLVDALTPVLLDMALIMKDRETILVGDLEYRTFQSSRFRENFYVVDPATGQTAFFCMKINPDCQTSPTFNTEIEKAMSKWKETHVPTGDAVEDHRDELSHRLFEEIRLEDSYDKNGYPDDVIVTSKARVQRIAFIFAPSYKEAVEDVGAFDKGNYIKHWSLEGSQAHQYALDDNWMDGVNPRHDPFDALKACNLLWPLIDHLDYQSKLADRAKEVGTRQYLDFNHSVCGKALDEAGQALALMDGGLPGETVKKALQTVYGRLVARLLDGQRQNISIILKTLVESERTSPETSLDLHDGDIYALVKGDFSALVMTDQNGQLILECHHLDGVLTGYTLARFADDPSENDTYRHPRDEGVPNFETVLGHMISGSTDFPGFCGTFRLIGDHLECTNEPRLMSRAINDGILCEMIIAETEVTIEEQSASQAE